MRRLLEFLAALGAVVLLHAFGTRASAEFPAHVDLFLVLVVAWAAESTTLGGLAAGLVVGFAADALSGGPFGLNGFADTLVGYGTALAVANLAKLNTLGAAALYAVAAAVQQLMLVMLVVLLVPQPSVPTLEGVLWKIASAGLLGILVFRGRRRFSSSVKQWRRSREDRLRF